MKYALITAIEGDGRNLNQQRGVVNTERRFESEAILCFEAWRKNAGWLADIPIYAYCPTKNGVGEATKSRFAELGVTYIERYHPITESFTSGFLNVPLVCSILERELVDIDVLIKIDLDMNLIQPLPESLVNSETLICGQYDDYCSAMQRKVKDDWQNPYDTGFTISRRDSGFYDYFFKVLMATMGSEDPLWLQVKRESGEYYLEEYVMDKIVNTGDWQVEPIQRYQIGEWYTPVGEFSDEELGQVYFWHEHIIHDPAYNKTREKVEYFNRMAKIKKELK